MTDIDAIRRAKESVEDELLRRPGVTGVDIGPKEVGGRPTGTLAIRVLVERKGPVPEAEMVPARIEGIPTDVIERRFELHVLRLPIEAAAAKADAERYDPLQGGISIGPCRSVGGYVFVGTLAVPVEDAAGGDPLLLSNFHVLALDADWKAGDQIAQPGLVDGGACPADVVATLVRATLDERADCAVASQSERGRACDVVDVGDVAGPGEASIGLAVQKRGRTTGHTFGTVDTVDLTITIDYGTGLGRKTLRRQVGVKPDAARNAAFGDHGDSGSAVLDAERRMVGLHFAGDPSGYGVANPLAAVQEALGIRLCAPAAT